MVTLRIIAIIWENQFVSMFLFKKISQNEASKFGQKQRILMKF